MSFIARAIPRARLVSARVALTPAPYAASSLRALSTSSPLRASAGYGDPQDEKIENRTPLGKTSTDAERKQGRTETINTNHGDGSGSTSAEAEASGGNASDSGATGSPAPDGKAEKKIKSRAGSSSAKSSSDSAKEGKVGSGGGKKGAGNKAKEDVSGQEIRETKKIGEKPKKED